MASDRNPLLEERANRIYEAIRQAEASGFQVVLDKYNHVDLYDPEDGQRTPLITIEELSEERRDSAKP